MISIESKRTIINQRLEEWNTSLFALELDARTGQHLVELKIERGKAMVDEATSKIKHCLAVIEFLEGELKSIETQ